MFELTIPLLVHALAAVLWVGGMAFAYGFLRPAAAAALAPAERVRLWRHVFSRFFPAVWVSAGLLLITGYIMVSTSFGGFANAGAHIHIMHLLAWIMTAIFAHIYFAPWRRFRIAVDSGDTERAGAELGKIRLFVAINLALGIIVVVAGASGRYW